MPSEKPWVKLWRREEGSFAQLPLFTRALAAELLKFAGDDGVLHLGGKTLHEAIAFQCGATRSDRRLLPRVCQELIDDGYIVINGDRAVIRNLSKLQGSNSRAPGASDTRQDHGSATGEPRDGHGGATTEPRTDREGSAKDPRTDHVTEAKLPKSRDGTDFDLKTTKSREDETRQDARAPREWVSLVVSQFWNRAAPPDGQRAHDQHSRSYQELAELLNVAGLSPHDFEALLRWYWRPGLDGWAAKDPSQVRPGSMVRAWSKLLPAWRRVASGQDAEASRERARLRQDLDAARAMAGDGVPGAAAEVKRLAKVLGEPEVLPAAAGGGAP